MGKKCIFFVVLCGVVFSTPLFALNHCSTCPNQQPARYQPPPGNCPYPMYAPPNYCPTCPPRCAPVRCNPCQFAPLCGTSCAISCASIGIGILAVAAVAAIILSVGDSEADHVH